MTHSKDGIRRHKAKDGTITYGVRIYVKGERKWIGSFSLLGAAHGDPETEARAARHQALTAKPTREMTVREYVKRYLAEYEGRHKDSSTDTARSSLKRFLADFGYRQRSPASRRRSNGHEEVGALERIDAAFEGATVAPFRSLASPLARRLPRREGLRGGVRRSRGGVQRGPGSTRRASIEGNRMSTHSVSSRGRGELGS